MKDLSQVTEGATQLHPFLVNPVTYRLLSFLEGKRDLESDIHFLNEWQYIED